MNIRAYEKKDWDSILAIFSKAKPDEFRGETAIMDIVPLEDDQDLMNAFEDSDVYVAEKDHRVVGFVGYSGQLISFLFVDPHHYRQGIGSGLLKHILRRIDGRAWLLVLKSNQPAINLYTKLGFVVLEEFIGKYTGEVSVAVLKLAFRRETSSKT
ncbi:N-acetyltransferase family protein [Parapedobacter sp. DT-150]|uniref:GNAT family N-acetyltransferase n=1 Tax=Parapedobacter sp. DT-150 TaxID=3396162 RepID=UPI003F1C6815